MAADNFYTSRRIDKYPPTGKLSECKKCITRHVNNWDPKSFTWILEEIDVPWMEEKWNEILGKELDKAGGDRTRITGLTILGRYLTLMKLTQYADKRWADTERIKQEAEERKKEAMLRQGYGEEEIEQALAFSNKPEEPPLPPLIPEQGAVSSIDALEPPGFEDTLTEDDRTQLAIKWGKSYKPYEWVQLEKYYQDMMQSFDIQTPSHEDYLKLICKTSLKSHQLVDMGDVEGFQKMSRVYDSLMKSAKFTAVQNKAESGEYINSISELVLLCEKEGGFIPRFYTDTPNDKADETLADLRRYTNTLVTEEMNLGNLIETAVKALQRQAEKAEDDDIEDDDAPLEERDYAEHYDFLEEQQKADDALMAEILGEGVKK